VRELVGFYLYGAACLIGGFVAGMFYERIDDE